MTGQPPQRPGLAATPSQARARLLTPLEAAGSVSWRAFSAHGVRPAFGALAAYRLRSTLMMVGIIVGISGVLTISAIGRAESAALTSQLVRLGSNLIFVTPGSDDPNPASARPLTVDDARLIRAHVSHIAALSPLDAGTEPLVAGRRMARAQVVAITGDALGAPGAQRLIGEQVLSGAFFTPQDDQNGVPVVVLGHTIAAQLFPSVDPLGQHLRIRNADFRVVGLLVANGLNGQVNLDNVAIVPFQAGQQRVFGSTGVSGIVIQADGASSVSDVVKGTAEVLDQAHHISPGRSPDFGIATFQ